MCSQGMLLRGFTTVRDACGADFGLQEAVERGIFDGPRLFIAGWPLTQTGGHGDARPKGARAMFCTCAGLGLCSARSPTASARCGARRASSCATAPTTSR